MNSLIIPQWPAPPSVKACATTRIGGYSLPPYDSLNLGSHVGDDPKVVQSNRHHLVSLAGLPCMPVWLDQIHSTNVVELPLKADVLQPPQADAAYSQLEQQVCAVMTADCLPVLFCSIAGDEVAAAHAGWRGLCDGILEQTVRCFRAKPHEIIAWLGPAIGPHCFEVGAEVRTAFMQHDRDAQQAFTPKADKYLADIYLLAQQRLQRMGIDGVYGEPCCTVSHPEQYFSYRRDRTTGRQASLIWLQPAS